MTNIIIVAAPCILERVYINSSLLLSGIKQLSVYVQGLCNPQETGFKLSVQTFT
jgi:hypothetical protein